MNDKAPTQVRLSIDAEQLAPLSPARKRFNSLVKRLERCRERLHAWNEALPRWRERYHEQAEPLFRRHAELDVAHLQLLDHAHASYKLGKADRRFLSELICEAAAALIEAGYDELKPIYDRHNEVGFDAELAESDQAFRQLMAAHFGLEPDELEGIDSPEQLFERLEERVRQQQAHADQRTQRDHCKRAARKQAQTAADPVAAPPLRELYRKLTTALHPDREPDPDERVRKTALMQRLNQAYASGNLLALIELQLEVGQLRPEQMRQLSDARIKQYNHDLDKQLVQTEQELLAMEESFRAEYGLIEVGRLDPQRLDALLARIKRERAVAIGCLEDELTQLQHPATFKLWLKREREWSRREQMIDPLADSSW